MPNTAAAAEFQKQYTMLNIVFSNLPAREFSITMIQNVPHGAHESWTGLEVCSVGFLALEYA